MVAKLNETQLSVLRWISAGNPGAEATNPQRSSARALASRRLVTIKGRGARWTASLTEAGQHYLTHGGYPPDHFGSDKPDAADRGKAGNQTDFKRRGKPTNEPAQPPPIELTVESPADKRRDGYPPQADSLFSESAPDPYDEKVLITVKEAAWMLSLPEHAIRQAVTAGDLDRVYIGEGGTHYRVVYGSLLAWVNSMPRESAHRRWWR